MAEDYGWPKVEHKKLEKEHNWQVLRQNIQNYIKGINYGYKNKLKDIGVDFIEARATFKDEYTVEFEYGETQK